MASSYDTTPSNLRSLRDRLTQAAKREGIVFGRLQQHVAMLVLSQLMAGLKHEDGNPILLVKGGTAVELRRGIPDSRTSRDLDAVVSADINGVHDQLIDTGAEGWEGFTAIFTPPVEFQVADGRAVNPCRFTAKLSYRGKPFTSVPIEISPVESRNADRLPWRDRREARHQAATVTRSISTDPGTGSPCARSDST